MDVFLSFLFNVVCSMVAAFAFLFFVLYVLRPSISITDCICKTKNVYDDSSEYVYVFKIYNKSFFSAFDLQFELFKQTQTRVNQHGINQINQALSLHVSGVKHLDAHASNRKCKNTHYAKHAYLFRTHEDLEQILSDDNQTIQLQIVLRHGLTGLSRAYKKDYINLKDVKSGKFNFGNSTEIE